jgi:hypothetical protein
MRLAHVPITTNLVSKSKFLTSFLFNSKYAIILFTCLMSEHHQGNSNEDIQMKQESLLFHGNTSAANSRKSKNLTNFLI